MARGTVRVRRLGACRAWHSQGRDSSQEKKSREEDCFFCQWLRGPNPVVTPGLLPSILLSPQDRGELHAELHAGNSEKMGHACFQFRTPRGQQPKNGWCLFPVPRHFENFSATKVFEHHIPARHRRLRYLARHLPGIEASRPRHLPGIEASALLPGIGATLLSRAPNSRNMC